MRPPTTNHLALPRVDPRSVAVDSSPSAKDQWVETVHAHDDASAHAQPNVNVFAARSLSPL